MTYPIVIVEIDKFSRLRILQTDGVKVGFIDRRVDDFALTLFPETNAGLEIDAAISGLHLTSIGADDPVRSAAETLRRIAAGEIVVVGLKPQVPE